MNDLSAGCLLLIAFGAASFALGKATSWLLMAAGVDESVASPVGVAVWWLGFCVLLCYGSLLLTPRVFFKDDSRLTTLRRRRRKAKAESKLRTAEFRMGFVFAMVGAAASQVSGVPTWAVWIIAISLAAVGGFVGYDFKRRVKALRQQHDALRETE